MTGGNIHIAKKSGDEDVPLTSPRVQIKNYNPKDLNTQTVDVYLDGEKVGDFQVTVHDVVKGLNIVPPTKQEVEWGTEMDLTGGKVQIVMKSGAVKQEDELQASMIKTEFNNKQEGKQTLAVEYQGFTGTFDMTVVDMVKSIRIKTLPDKTEYDYGEDLDVTGGTVEVTKSSGITVIPMTRDMIKDYNSKKSGSQMVTVNYKGAKDTFIVVVGPAPAEPDKPDTPDKPDVPDTPKPSTPKPTTPKPTTPKPSTPIEETPVQEPVEKPKEEKPVEQKPMTETPKKEEKPTEVLGVKDKDDSNIKVKAGITSALGLFLLLLLLLAKRNVKVYVEEGEEFEFGGMDKISKKNRRINIDKFIDGETYKNRVLIHLNDKISEKLDGKEIEIKHRGEVKKFTIKYDDEPFEIVLE